MRQVKPAGLQASRSCHGKLMKLMWKVGITFTFSICIIPKNQSLISESNVPPNLSIFIVPKIKIFDF
jgi:hypothetical protein